MEEVRCRKCDKLLGKVEGLYEIQCTRCNKPKHIESGCTFVNNLNKEALTINTTIDSMVNIIINKLSSLENIEDNLSLDIKRNKLSEKGYKLTYNYKTSEYEIIKDGKSMGKL